MKWLEKNIGIFFKINGFLMLLIVMFGIWTMLWTFGIPNNRPSTWTPYQWNMINFLWKPVLIGSVINIFVAVFYFMRIYFIFPIVVLFIILNHALYASVWNINQIMTKGFIYPMANIQGILVILQFVLAIIGTILWVRKLIGKTHNARNP